MISGIWDQLGPLKLANRLKAGKFLRQKETSPTFNKQSWLLVNTVFSQNLKETHLLSI